ncbi:MAG: hypothetical protein GF405_06400 [Candidatus Eisenbacteria bacterium]|nr:hypothetical protein [Candidatus Eisenbacteria bacterium]
MPREEALRLSALAPGAAARVLDVEGEGAFRRRLLDMGFVNGAVVHVIRRAPLRNPTEYSVGGSHVTLRSTEASRVLVEPVAAPPRCRRRGKRGLRRFFGRGRGGGRGHGRKRTWRKTDDEPSR